MNHLIILLLALSAIIAVLFINKQLRTNTWLRIIAAILLAAIFFVWLAQYLPKKQDPVTSLTALDTLAKRSVTFDNAKGKQIIQNDNVTASDAQIKALSDSLFALKNANAKLVKKVEYLTQVNQHLAITNDSIPYDTTRYAGVHHDSLAVPVAFSQHDSAKTISGVVTKHGIDSLNVDVPNSLIIRGAEVKYGFLNLQRKTVTQAFNTSPLLINSGIATYEKKYRPNAWNRWIKPTLTAVAASYATYKISQLKN